jgi:periplasmic protein TonB
MTAAAILPAADKDSLRRWVFAASVVVLVHGAIVFLLMYLRDTSLAGAPPAAIMIELAPLDVAPPVETPPGPQMRQAEPEEVEPPQPLAVPELPPVPKPAVVLMTPPKPKPKPKKVVKEIPKPVVKREREPPAPRTSAPKHSDVARSLTAAAPRQDQAGSTASLASWRARLAAHLLSYKPTSAEGAGTVTVSFTLTRGGRLLASGLAGSSGSSALDKMALEMVRRANPFPAAPSEVSGGSFPVTVPVRFFQR